MNHVQSTRVKSSYILDMVHLYDGNIAVLQMNTKGKLKERLQERVTTITTSAAAERYIQDWVDMHNGYNTKPAVMLHNDDPMEIYGLKGKGHGTWK